MLEVLAIKNVIFSSIDIPKVVSSIDISESSHTKC